MELGGFVYHSKSFKLLILARRVANLLRKIVDERHQKIDDIHLIGFSLGAHLMGTTGRMMKVVKKKVGRITGKTIDCSIYINYRAKVIFEKDVKLGKTK